jgi:bifunctional DNA-binding transcriptional regulator/antitoxin component of YhaV-PrlF toxin-antitoxin module
MKEVRILSIDNRGRIVIPQIIRKSLGLTTDSQLMMVADSEEKTIKITPVGLATGEEAPVKIKITMEDIPGALAKIATTFGELGISLVYGESVIVEKDKKAIWTVISPNPRMDFEELENALREKGDAKKVEFIPLT